MEPFHADWFGQYKYDSFCMQSLQKELKCSVTGTIRFDSKWKKLFAHH